MIRKQALIHLLTPLVAVALALAVGAAVIWIFITSYTLTENNLSALAQQGLPAHTRGQLSALQGKSFEDRTQFASAVQAAIGDQAWTAHAQKIQGLALQRENPFKVYQVIYNAALKDRKGWGNVWYRATPLIFTGLAVALAFQCGLFNIGGEGQMVLGGFAIAWVGFSLRGLPSGIHIPLCILAGMLAGGLWGAIPGYLKARRGVHEVVATIMLNWMAVALVQYLTMVYKPAGDWIPHTAKIAPSAQLSRLHVYLNALGMDFPRSSQVNTAVFLALGMAVAVSFLLRRSKLGYEIRAVGHNPEAAACSGISVPRNTVLAMALSGALAGLAGVNQVMGYKHRFRYGIFEGLGFDGIGVAFIGRNSPLGVVLAALLFGILDQGGLAIDVVTRVPREIVLVLKAIILIFVVVSGEISKRMLKSGPVLEGATP